MGGYHPRRARRRRHGHRLPRRAGEPAPAGGAEDDADGVHVRGTLKRFEYECALLGRLQHPGIAQIIEAGVETSELGGRPYFAMELVEGQPLLRHASEAALDLRARIELMLKVCDAVHHAHQKGIIHRDLKPQNILVGASGQPKILDFGVAKATDADHHLATQRTQVGQILGTLAYMSPEQASGNPDEVDTRADIYSLGVVLYELLANRLPFDVRGKPIADAARIIREQDAVPLGRVARALRGDLDTIVAKALEKDRARRYQAASDLAADLQRFLNQETVLARPVTRTYRLRKFVRRNRAAVLGVVGMFVALTIGLINTLAAERRARFDRDAALSLADAQRLQELITEADALWPRRPELAGQIDQWLVRSRALCERLPRLRAYVGELSASHARRLASDYEQQWLQASLTSLIAQLERFADPDPRVGVIADVEQRRQVATSIVRATTIDCAPDWRTAIEEIGQDPKYHGLVLQPQVGLVPLEPDPESGLWEFWLWETGERPERDEATGRYLMHGDTGMVLVLVPGGKAWLGASNVAHGPNPDPQALPEDGPVREVELDAFFVSKYELTEGQWLRLTGHNPSETSQAFASDGPLGLERPVGNVTWNDCERWLAHLGLLLPTEAQWEYAARAGTSTPWFSGASKESLADAANISDLTVRHALGVAAEAWDDHFFSRAPVGSYRANAFGLHDVLGNVSEWCRDRYGKLDLPLAPHDGLRQAPESPTRLHRGGNCLMPAFMSRVTSRVTALASELNDEIGVRPARSID
ncbi:MAG: bifunctional serine/threonine-protein kinase/formylglycine-generating enzyme family protein [Planctomycetota bacterium]